MAISQYKALGEWVGAGAFSDTETVQRFPLGFEVNGVKVASASNDTGGFGVFAYAQGSNVSSAGQFVHLHNQSAVLFASANSQSVLPVGVACAALSATNLYGWVQVQGYVDYAKGTNSSIAAGVGLYPTGTAGVLATSGGTGNRVWGVVAPASYTSSQSNSLTVILQRNAGIVASNQ